MSQEDTTPDDDAPKGDVEPNATEPNAGGKQDEPEVFDRDYVEKLRKEAAANRVRAQAAEAKAKEFEDRDKTELERATEKATAAEERAAKAEQKAMRHEVATAKGIQAKHLKYLTGSTQEELEASADEILADFPATTAPRVDPDAGRRGAGSTASSMDDLIRGTGRPVRAPLTRG